MFQAIDLTLYATITCIYNSFIFYNLYVLKILSKQNFNLVEMGGFEPPTSCLPDKRSPTELHPRINQLKLE